MIHSGLVSITFRALPAKEIIEMASAAGLAGIEWGGDIHVPHGDVGTAGKIGQATRQAGLAVAAYGSYYRVGHDEPAPFETVVETTVALEAPLIRVWAGKQGSAQSDRAYRDRVVAESQRIADVAAAKGLSLAYEFHNNTLTDTAASAGKLVSDVGRENVRCYWQARVGAPVQDCLNDVKALAPVLANVHVFAWSVGVESPERMTLQEGADAWRTYLPTIAAAAGDRFAMLEFVKDDSPKSLAADAKALNTLVAEVNGE